ncbi:hypothetical protein JKF63_04440 [Porcisia hertigi]|uniref:Uncharacterized protein n=1 Tax=Porcisia hertigi TaxID=2761500 RepID=A0A836INR9_9TRYP|nr:hypothetical protein JKF63_04440 [Porcisia hertigi]
MHDDTNVALTSPQPSPSPTEAARARACRAELRLRNALRLVSAQQRGGSDHLRKHCDPVADTAGTAHMLPRTSSSLSVCPNFASSATAAESSPSPPCPLVLEWPIAPLAQRVKQKEAREAIRQQRRDARKAAAAAAAAAAATSTTAAEIVRNALSQPLGAVAARLFSAAASGAPLLFSDVAATTAHVADGLTSNGPASLPSAGQSAHETVGRGAPAPTQSTATDVVSNHEPVSATLRHQGSSPKRSRPQPAGVLGERPMRLLTRTLREAGTAARSGSPQTRGEETRKLAPHDRDHARHDRHSRRSGKPEWNNQARNASGNGPPAADRHLPDSPCTERCMGSASSSDSCNESEASWSSSRSRMPLAYGGRSPPFEPLTPLTIPRDGRYDPHAPLLPLMRCYGDTPTHEVLFNVSSTSTQRTASRSFSTMSSEWSVESSSTGTSVAVAASASSADLRAPDEPGEAAKTTNPACAAKKNAKGQRQVEALRHHRRSAPRSPISNTQLSYGAEMDAIERGVVAPYVSYLFSPEARVVDLRQLKSRVGCSDPTPWLGATCVEFSRASDVYLVGTTSGVLWRVPVGGGAVVVRATPLGSLWPPHAATSAKPTVSGITVGMGNSSGVASDATCGRSSTLLPVPLPGHTAAILSITFNDDGSLFVTTGMDGCVIVWNASTSAKLRRINVVWAFSTSQSSTVASTTPTYAGVDAAAGQRAPHLACFMPQNNNYLLVSYLGSSELHLYNSSTGLPVTNVAGAGMARAPARMIHVRCKDAARRHDSSGVGVGASPQSAAPSRAITALAVNPVSLPFFFSGDASGTVVLWTYRAGDLAATPTLRAATAATTTLVSSSESKQARTRPYVVDPLLPGALGRAGNGGEDMIASSAPPHQLPELRRVTALALPEHMGGIAAVRVSTLHVSQLQSLFHRRGPRRDAASGQSTSDGGAACARSTPQHPLESTAQVFRAAAQQNRACWAAARAHGASDKATAAGVARNRRDAPGRESKHLQPAPPSRPTAATDVAATSDRSKNLPHVLADLPALLSETFSALWRSGGRSPPTEAHPGPATNKKKLTTAEAKRPAAFASTAGTATPATALSEGELLRQLRDDALDVVCPFLVLVTLPCDTIYALGVLLQLQPSSRPSGAGSAENVVGKRTPTVCYSLYPLLKMTSQSRLRHLGVGAAQSPDNPRLIVVATPCEEGFVRVEPLLRLEPPPLSEQHAHPVGVPAGSTSSVDSLRLGHTAVEHGEGWRRSPSHVLATLPMPYGGRCTGVAWSPNGRFLVAITAEGVIYQWTRVYLLDPSFPPANSTAAVATVVTATTPKEGVTRAGDCDEGAAPTQRTTSSKGKAKTKPWPTVGGAAVATARRCGCTTDKSDAVNGMASRMASFTRLLGAPMASAVGPPSGLPVGENTAARAAFSEEDAWRESLHRELERQRRAQAALKLVTHAAAEDDDTVYSSGYCLSEYNSPNSAVARDSLEGEGSKSHF